MRVLFFLCGDVAHPAGYRERMRVDRKPSRKPVLHGGEQPLLQFPCEPSIAICQCGDAGRHWKSAAAATNYRPRGLVPSGIVSVGAASCMTCRANAAKRRSVMVAAMVSWPAR